MPEGDTIAYAARRIRPILVGAVPQIDARHGSLRGWNERLAGRTIEAVELPGRWVLGVQWHPEDTAEHDGDQQRLFDAFVAACGHVPAAR